MKKLFALLLTVCIALSLFSTSVAEDEWICPSCNAVSTGKFCSECGTKRPAAGQSDGSCTLNLSIEYEKNLFMAQYAVDLMIDDQKITTMQHGQGYTGSVSTTPGKHVIKFVQSDDSSVSGSYSVQMEGDASFACTIHSKTLSIKIDDIRFGHESAVGSVTNNTRNNIDEDDESMMMPETDDDGPFQGPVRLDLVIDFKENLMLSRYDVDLYLDDTFVTTLSHGTGYQGTFGVENGIHVITFQKTGDQTIKGISQFNMSESTSFSCTIECKYNQVKVTNEKIGTGSNVSALSKEEYIAACKELNYKEVERNPDDFNGYKAKLSGKVIQVSEGLFDSVKLRVNDSNGNTWYVTYTRSKGESRILPNDKVDIYGECKGVKTYISILGGTVTIPAIDARFIDLK